MSLPLLSFKGFWYTVPNTPALADGIGTLGDCYHIYTITGRVITDLYDRDLGSGLKSWINGNYIYYDGSLWRQIGDVASSGSGTVTSVTGTSNRIDVSSGTTTPKIDISQNYVGQTSITTLGTITAGIWHGTAIDLANYVSGNLAVSHLNSGTGATSSTFWRGDGIWAATSGVTSVSGVTNRIDVSSGSTTPLVNISPIFEALLGKVASPLSQFALTTAAQLAGIISGTTGTGNLVFSISPTFTGSPLAPTQTAGDNSTKIATTAYVDRALPLIVTSGSTSTLTINCDITALYEITALSTAMTIAAPTGTPHDGQKLMIRILDNGTARALTWTTGSGGSFRASSDLALPTTTVLSKTMYLGFQYNSAASRWDLLAFLNNF